MSGSAEGCFRVSLSVPTSILFQVPAERNPRGAKSETPYFRRRNRFAVRIEKERRDVEDTFFLKWICVQVHGHVTLSSLVNLDASEAHKDLAATFRRSAPDVESSSRKDKPKDMANFRQKRGQSRCIFSTLPTIVAAGVQDSTNILCSWALPENCALPPSYLGEHVTYWYAITMSVLSSTGRYETAHLPLCVNAVVGSIAVETGGGKGDDDSGSSSSSSSSSDPKRNTDGICSRSRVEAMVIRNYSGRSSHIRSISCLDDDADDNGCGGGGGGDFREAEEKGCLSELSHLRLMRRQQWTRAAYNVKQSDGRLLAKLRFSGIVDGAVEGDLEFQSKQKAEDDGVRNDTMDPRPIVQFVAVELLRCERSPGTSHERVFGSLRLATSDTLRCPFRLPVPTNVSIPHFRTDLVDVSWYVRMSLLCDRLVCCGAGADGGGEEEESLQWTFPLVADRAAPAVSTTFRSNARALVHSSVATNHVAPPPSRRSLSCPVDSVASLCKAYSDCFHGETARAITVVLGPS